MENITEEKGLVKIDNSIFAKVRRFLTSIFKKKNYQLGNPTEEQTKKQLQTEQQNSNEIQKSNTYEGKEEIEQKLKNYYESIKKII